MSKVAPPNFEIHTDEKGTAKWKLNKQWFQFYADKRHLSFIIDYVGVVN